MAPGGPGASSRTGLRAELMLQGMRGAAHLAGRNPNLPEAAVNRPGLGEGNAFQDHAGGDTTRHQRTEPSQSGSHQPCRAGAGSSCCGQLRETR